MTCSYLVWRRGGFDGKGAVRVEKRIFSAALLTMGAVSSFGRNDRFGGWAKEGKDKSNGVVAEHALVIPPIAKGAMDGAPVDLWMETLMSRGWDKRSKIGGFGG